MAHFLDRGAPSPSSPTHHPFSSHSPNNSHNHSPNRHLVSLHSSPSHPPSPMPSSSPSSSPPSSSSPSSSSHPSIPFPTPALSSSPPTLSSSPSFRQPRFPHRIIETPHNLTLDFPPGEPTHAHSSLHQHRSHQHHQQPLLSYALPPPGGGVLVGEDEDSPPSGANVSWTRGYRGNLFAKIAACYGYLGALRAPCLRFLSPILVVCAGASVLLVIYLMFAHVMPFVWDVTTPIGAANILLGLLLAFNIVYNFAMVSIFCGPGHPQDLQEPVGGLSLSGEEVGKELGGKIGAPLRKERTERLSSGGVGGESPLHSVLQEVPKLQIGFSTYCKSCRTNKPARTHHCTVCDRCVLLMDHHCPWIGQCVGLHNVRHFTLFLVQLWLGCTYCLYITCPLIFKVFENEAALEIDHITPVVSVIWVFSLTAGAFFGMVLMAPWQMYLVLTGQTTIEYYFYKAMTAVGNTTVNVWDEGYRQNFYFVFGYDIYNPIVWCCPTSYTPPQPTLPSVRQEWYAV